MSLSALFIAPLNSINNTIKDGNLLQVAYIRERFNYAIITRYLLVLPAIIFVENIIFSTLSLIFVVGDIIYFYRSYANFIFNNNKVMVSFLTDKIKEEDKTRADFLQSFKDFKKTILRYERKNKSLHTSYNNRWTFTSQSGVQDVDRHKLKHFLVALNHRLEINLETNKDNNQQRRFRNFSSNVFFNFRDLKISLSIDYQQITKSETDNNLFVGLKNEFYEAFDYLKKNEGKSILPHLMDGLDIHFFDLYQKNEFKVLFSNIALMQSAIAKTDLRIGNGIFDVLYFFNKIFNQYPNLNKVANLNEKFYQLWLEVFKQSMLLDKTLIDFIFKNFSDAIKKEFFTEDQLVKFDRDLVEALQQKSDKITDDFIFYFLSALTNLALQLQTADLKLTMLFIQKVDYFGKEIHSDYNLGLAPEVRQNGIIYAHQGLFLLAAYFFQHNKKAICQKILEIIKDNIFQTFLYLAKNEQQIKRWSWAEWFIDNHSRPTFGRIKLIELITNLLVFYLNNNGAGIKNFTKLEIKKEHLNYLKALYTKISSTQKQQQKAINYLLQKALIEESKALKSTNIILSRQQEFFEHCNLEYTEYNKISDFIKPKLQNKLHKNLGYQSFLEIYPFLRNRSLQLEEYEDYGLHLVETENRYFIKTLEEKLGLQTISYEELFTKIIPKTVIEKDSEVMFFGRSSYKLTRFFTLKNQFNKFMPDLELLLDKKQKSDEIEKKSFLMRINNQSKPIHFLPIYSKSGAYLFIYKKSDEINLNYFKTTKKTEDLKTNYTSYLLTKPKMHSHAVENYFKNHKLTKLSLIEKKTIMIKKLQLNLAVAPCLELPQEKYLSKIFYIQRQSNKEKGILK